MLLLKIIPLPISSALAAHAQPDASASAPTKLFRDPAYGVRFRYPGQWAMNKDYKFDSPLSITSFTKDLRGTVYFTRHSSFNPYPQTNLDGAQFGYAVAKAASGEECLRRVLQGDANTKTLAQESINGIRYAHGHAAEAGMCHQIAEDIYATSRDGVCYVFDLAVHTLCVGVIDNTGEITEDELARVRTSLEKILSSVQMNDIKN